MTASVRLPRETGAWYMALTCWLVGWAAGFRLAWEPLVVAGAVVCLFAASQGIRAARTLWVHDASAALRIARVIPALLIIPALALVVVVSRITDEAWLLALILPGLLYGPIIICGIERLPVGRILAVVALTAIAPATYGVARGTIDERAAMLWITLGGYFLLASLLVIARIRRGTRILLPLVRSAAPLAIAVALFAHTPWLLVMPFAIVAVRAWSVARSEEVDARSLGNRELLFSATAAGLILLGLWLA